MPPRLLDAGGVFGGCGLHAPDAVSTCDRYGYVDTVEVFGGWAPLGAATVNRVSNQYAAMPSMHVGWSLWVALATFATTRRRLLRALAVVHPLVTIFVILVTGNHYWIDGVGGALCLAAGYVVARAVERCRLDALAHAALTAGRAADGAPRATLS